MFLVQKIWDENDLNDIKNFRDVFGEKNFEIKMI
jgi:hypothetical protein